MALTQVKALGIAADAIDETKIADNGIDSEHYNDGSIDHEHLANDAIDGDNLADNACDSEHYTDGSIDHAHLADDCVDGDNIADNSVGLAHMAGGTDGVIITYDASGDPVHVGPGNDGQVLTSTGAGSPPAFEDAAGGGKLLQFVNGTTTSLTNNTSQDNTYINHYLTITPVASDSTLVFCLAVGVQRENQQTGFTFRASIDDGSNFYFNTGGGDYGWHDSGGQSNDMYWVEGPFYWTRTAGTAGSAETHKIYVEQRTADSTGYDLHTRSSFVCWEVAA